VDGVSLTVAAGPFGMAIVGESGSGKTTLGRAILRLVPAAGGTVLFDGQDVLGMRGRRLREYRRAAQIVFQDVDNSLDPRMRVGAAIGEVLTVHGLARAAVGDRAAVARALAVSPRLLVLDEPTSALDVTAQARILELVRRLRAERELAYLFITHNLAIAGELCEQTTVLYLGRVAETGPTSSLLATPAHPYTLALLSSVPELDPARRRTRIALPGGPLSATTRPPGCPFHPRCPLAIDTCRVSVPELRPVAPGRRVACHRGHEVLAGLRPARDGTAKTQPASDDGSLGGPGHVRRR